MSVREYIGARYVPVFADPLQWDNTKSYEPLTVVMDTGTSYVSRQSVPAGIAIDNETYWVRWADYNAQLEEYIRQVQTYSASITALNDALPIADYDDENTVSDAITNLGALLPVSEFDTINTVNARLVALENRPIVHVDLANDSLQDVLDNMDNGGAVICTGEAPLDDVYTISSDIIVIGGKYKMTPRVCVDSSDYGVKSIFNVDGAHTLMLFNCKFEATSYGQIPFIYARGDIPAGLATDSNVECFTARNGAHVDMISCDIKNCMGGFVKDSSAKLDSNRAITSMFIFGNTSDVICRNNAIEVQDSNITNYYHVYYLDTNSKLEIVGDDISYFGEPFYFDIIHSGVLSETAGLDCIMRDVTWFGNFRRFYQGEDVTIKRYNCHGMMIAPDVKSTLNETINCEENFGLSTQIELPVWSYAYTDGYSIGSTGSPISNPGHHATTNFIPVDFSFYRCPYRLPAFYNAYSAMNEDLVIAWYDSSQAFIKRESYNYISAVPTGAKYFKLSKKNDMSTRILVWDK